MAVNKADTAELQPYVETFRELGIEELYPISAEHGLGVAELLDAIFEVLPEVKTAEDAKDAKVSNPHGCRRVPFAR